MIGTIGFVFMKDAVFKYKLTPKECVFLDWFVFWKDSGKQEFIDLEDGRYYWIKYSKAIEDIGCVIGINNRISIGHLFKSLIRKGVLRKKDTSKNYVRRLYFKIDETVLFELKHGADTMAKQDPFGLKKEVEPSGLNKNVVKILEEVDLLQHSGRKLFSYRGTDKVTKSLLKFNKMVLDVYTGRFSSSKFDVSDDFIKKNDISDETYRKIRKCKGDWEKTRELFISAAQTYLLWFDEHYAPLSKKWLPRDIGTWVYDYRNQASLFLACITKEPERFQEVLSQKVIDNLPTPVYQAAIKLREEYFPNSNFVDLFWFGVNQAYKAEKRLRKLYRSDYRISMWLESEGVWTARYLDWVKSCWGENTRVMLREKHIGPRGKPWVKWIESDPDLSHMWPELYSESCNA